VKAIPDGNAVVPAFFILVLAFAIVVVVVV
jgi:hypothetical protein